MGWGGGDSNPFDGGGKTPEDLGYRSRAQAKWMLKSRKWGTWTWGRGVLADCMDKKHLEPEEKGMFLGGRAQEKGRRGMTALSWGRTGRALRSCPKESREEEEEGWEVGRWCLRLGLRA